MKKNKRRRQFYNDKDRNTSWTEEPKGRYIDFADKYALGEGQTNKYDESARNMHRDALKQIEKTKKLRKNILAVFLAVVLIATGYTLMDVYMIRHAKPAEMLISNNDGANSSMSEMTVSLASEKIESVSLDNSAMLDAVISQARNSGCNSIVFDAKRSDGTIGYQSSLAEVDTYNAMSDAGNDSTGSLKKLADNDILPVARISCYVDNVATNANPSMAVTDTNGIYKDKDGDSFLNPDSDDAYGYIRDIIRELNDCGVQVFILTGCDLPGSISSSYNDGFDVLVEKLNAEFDGKIKFLKEIRVELKGTNSESDKISETLLDEEIKSLESINDNQIYAVYSQAEHKVIYDLLSENGINNFILE